jgi:hypothetical protein
MNTAEIQAGGRRVITQARASSKQGRTKHTAGAARCDDERETTGHLSLRSSQTSVYRTGDSPIRRSRQFVQENIMTNDCRQTSRRDASIIDRSCGAISDLVQFGRPFGRFGSVWSTSTKSKSQDVKRLLSNLVDLVDIHTRGVSRCARMRPRPPARPRSQDPYTPSEHIDQIDQIATNSRAVLRFSFGRRRPNTSKSRSIWSKSLPNRSDNRLVRGRSR